MRMNNDQLVQEVEEEEEERPWEEVIKRRVWETWETRVTRPSPYYSSFIKVKKKKKVEKKKWRFASVIIYQSNKSSLQSFFFNGSLFSTVEKPREKERWGGWKSLPSTALLNIFCKSELKDRLKSIPLVCKSWKYVTDDPRCWYSMIPDSVSPEDAFIKNTSGYEFESYQCKYYYYMKLVKKNDYDFFLIGISRLFKEEGDDQVDEEEIYDDGDEEEEEVRVGLSRLRTLIKKSGGGAAITSLYLSPFLHWRWDEENDEILHLISNCCPNLKHISFNGSCNLSTKALLQLVDKCKKLELVDVHDSLYEGYKDPLFIQEFGKCLPNLRGIRIESQKPGPTSVFIATYLPQLKLLSLFARYLKDEHLSTILFSCLELQYLYVKGHPAWLYYSQDIVDQACAQIPECYFEKCYPKSWGNWSYGTDSYYSNYSERRMLKCNEAYMDDYHYSPKQRKEDQYVSILKEKKEYHYILKKKERDQCNSSFKKKKKKYQYVSTVRKMKKIDQCDYADYVIQ